MSSDESSNGSISVEGINVAQNDGSHNLILQNGTRPSSLLLPEEMRNPRRASANNRRGRNPPSPPGERFPPPLQPVQLLTRQDLLGNQRRIPNERDYLWPPVAGLPLQHHYPTQAAYEQAYNLYVNGVMNQFGNMYQFQFERNNAIVENLNRANERLVAEVIRSRTLIHQSRERLSQLEEELRVMNYQIRELLAREERRE